jgi:autotransporter-associated beta strand protein
MFSYARFVLFVFGCAGSAGAVDITWTGTNGTTFSVGQNWGGAAPADDLTSDRGVFAGTPTANLPQLTASRLITGLYFSGSTTGGWTLGSNSSSNVLTLGASGVDSRNISGTNTISANVTIGAVQSWNQSTGGMLKVTGGIAMGASGAPVTYTWTTGGSGSGTILLDPSAGNSVNIFSSSTTAALQVNKSLTLGSAANSTNSTNIISTSGAGAGIAVAGNQTLTVNSGTWLTNDLGRNSGTSFAGTVNLNGGTIASGGGRYLANINGSVGAVWNVNGGTLKIAGGGNTVSNSGSFQLGAAVTGTPLSSDSIKFNLQTGFVDVAKTIGTASTIGAVVLGANVPQVLMNQSGGVAQFGVTTGYNVLTNATNANAGNGLAIGVVSTASGANKAAYTLSGGRLLIAGALVGNAPGAATAGGVSNFNFMGGTLTVGNYTATNLGSSATATSSANQTASSSSIGTLINYGGTLAPGGDLVTNTPDASGNALLTYTPTSGKTSIAGNYQVNSGTLAVNIGGTTASTAFQDAANSGKFANLAVSGTTVLGGTLAASLINGNGGTPFVPTSANTFNIIVSTGAISGNFTNVNAITNRVNLASGTGSMVFARGSTSTLSAYSSGADLIWAGNGGQNPWDVATTSTFTKGGVASTFSNANADFVTFDQSGIGNGTVNLNSTVTPGALYFANTSGTYTVTGSGKISGGATVTVQGAGGTVLLDTTNDYTGQTTISAGTLKLGGSGTLGASTSNLGVIASGAVLDLNGTNQTVAGFSGTSAGQIQNNSGGGTSVLTLGGASGNTFAGVLADNNTVATGGKVGLALSGTGAVTLSGANTFSGGTSVGNTSTLLIGVASSNSGSTINSGATGKGGVTFANGASLSSSSSANTWYVPSITLQGALNLVGTNRQSLSFNTLELTSGNKTININGKSLAVTGGDTLVSNNTGLSQWEMASNTAFTNTIQNGLLNLETTNGAFTSGSYAAIRTNNALTFTNADLRIGSNVLFIAGASSGSFGSSAATSPNLTVDGLVDFAANSAAGRTSQVKSLSGSGSLFGSMVATNVNSYGLTLSGTSGSTTFSGVIADGPGTGALSLSKTGGSTQILSGTNSYTGATAVSGGTLIIGSGGSINNTSSLAVSSGARLIYNSTTTLSVAPSLSGNGVANRAVLGGSGSVNASVPLDNLGDVLSPGNSPGIQSYTVGQSWNSFSYDWEVNSFSGTVAGTNFDQIAIIGGLNLTGATEGSYNLNVMSLAGLSNVAGNVADFSNHTRSWNILTTTAGINGFDALYWTINTGDFSSDPLWAGAWSLAEDSGNLVLTYSAVPEPAAAILVGGLGMLALLRRRRA